MVSSFKANHRGDYESSRHSQAPQPHCMELCPALARLVHPGFEYEEVDDLHAVVGKRRRVGAVNVEQDGGCKL